ncbi:exported hypothetical protein [Vibrio coralliirubri]|uniref:hypothetical protein n=1 Tax=Vibrio coralliirubri TaxID=1516159 RepID=UPI000636A171|nr:hypothetical protein [Vibrio coralliirubri]CDT14505.1 exported hypothetical protein [Vibrio coralliirubri]CDT85077.1 exported hypothetical protein [Vibrio coralliirubri]
MKHKLNKGVTVLTLAILAGCGGSDGDSVGGSSDYKPLESNTKGATSFAFAKGSSMASVGTMSSVNGYSATPTLTANSGSCDELVKVVEVEVENDDPDVYVTEKVFMPSDSGNCFIGSVKTMKEHLILSGSFSNLADANGDEIAHCSLIALPLENETGLAECLLGTRADSDLITHTHTLYDVNPTADGTGLQIMYEHEREMNGLYLPTLGFWNGNGVVKTIHQSPTEEGGRDIHVKASWSYDGSSFFFVRNRGYGYWHQPAFMYDGGYPDYDESLQAVPAQGYDHSRVVQVGEHVITNIRSEDYSVRGNVIINTKSDSSFEVTPFILDGNEVTVNLLGAWRNFQHSGEEYVYFGANLIGDGFYSSGYFRVLKDDVTDGNDSVGLELMHELDSSEQHESRVGDSYRLYLSDTNPSKLTYLDLTTGEYHSDNILDRQEFDDYIDFEVGTYVGGIKVIANGASGAAELFIDQITGEITDSPIDRQEIGGTIPLFPSDGV